MKYPIGNPTFWQGESRPVRALWIEISDYGISEKQTNVEAREGLVD